MIKITEELIQLEQKDIKVIREKITIEQNNVCPIANITIPDGNHTLDHQHMTKRETRGVDGAGTIRGVLDYRANAWEGKVSKSFVRCGLAKEVDLVVALRNLANYLEREPYPMIHPNEKPKEKKLLKRPFAKIKKLYAEEFPKRKLLEYPKSGKATVLIKELSEKYPFGEAYKLLQYLHF